MRSIRKYGKGDRKQLQHIYKAIKKREDYIADMELELMEHHHLMNRLISRVVRLGDYGIPITGKVMETLINITNDERVHNNSKRY